jgi:hypothetical protein
MRFNVYIIQSKSFSFSNLTLMICLFSQILEAKNVELTNELSILKAQQHILLNEISNAREFLLKIIDQFE